MNLENEQISIVLSAISGYGFYYLKTLLEEFPSGKIKISGIIDPFPEKSGLFDEVKKRKIPIYSDIKDFYKNDTADLAIISSPIHYHVPQSISALKHGSNVLCEKPIGATIQEANELIKVKNETKCWMMIGYQWSFTNAIQSLKKDIISGLFGKPIRLKTLCFWTRGVDYYNRNNWAGKIKDDEGRWILDSPANNAMAHFLHNLFFVLGKEINLSALPKEVEAECYRANPIENYDTVACQVYTYEGVELLFYASHSTFVDKGPMFNFEFEDAVISYGEESNEIIAKDRKGNIKSYGNPDAEHQFLKLFKAVEFIKNPDLIICGPEAASSQTICINGIQESVGEITDFPKSVIVRDENDKRFWVKELAQSLFECYNNNILPNVAKYYWAKSGKKIELENYNYFPIIQKR